MPLRIIEVFAAPGHTDTLAAVAERFKALNFWKDSATASTLCRIVARAEKQQELIDQIQGALGKDGSWRITILPVEATIPEPEEDGEEKRSPEQVTREELFAEIDRGARIDSTFLLLVVLSTIVATIGLLASNVAVVIAAMLIAPLLGPNTAMAFGSTLGDIALISRAMLANAAGICISVGCAAAVGMAVPFDGTSTELLARTRLGFENVLLALAAGAAGALSLTTRISGTLVGVMVAVALLPPAVTFGYMVGAGQVDLAAGAAALLAVNIVCVNLSAQVVFLFKGIKPRTWIERRAAQQSVHVGLALTSSLLLALMAIVYWHR